MPTFEEALSTLIMDRPGLLVDFGDATSLAMLIGVGKVSLSSSALVVSSGLAAGGD